jgi:hypothetical protein
MGKALVDRDYVRVMFKQIFAGLQRRSAMKRMPQHKCIPAADHARGLQFPGNAASRISGAQHDELLPAWRHGHQQAERQPCGDGEQR